MKYSIIIPVYNRPDEVDELLESLTHQTLSDFEVLIVEDGSAIPCKSVVERYMQAKGTPLDICYYAKANSGPGQSRNYGAERAKGEYLIVLDSDCVLPPGYLQAVDDELTARPCDAFGGPDSAHPSFTPVQKAISYSMTSFFTTGGIRGGKKQLDKKFYPRSFNMGIRAELYRRLEGFSAMRFGEDIDFSIRIYKSGARCRLFPEAWVWHKRRTDFTKFFRQVHNSGIARINLMKRHPGSLKLVHLLPAAFTLALLLSLCLEPLGIALGIWWAIPALWLAYSLLIWVDSTLRNRSLWIGLLSIRAAFTQLIGYGTGFLRAWWLRCVCGRDEELQAFKKNFYD